MSLKAKLEAVIYAAEEPVALAQLATLFATEALAWKAEQEGFRAEQEAASSALDRAQSTDQDAGLDAELDANRGANFSPAIAEPLPLLAQGFNDREPDLADAKHLEAPAPPEVTLADSTAEPASDDTPQPSAVAVLEGTPEAAPSDSAVAHSSPSEDPAEIELEARRLARLREREVRSIIRQLLDEIMASYASESRGVEIREIAGGFRMGTKPECHDAVRLFVKSLKPALKLSLPALETLAVIAYKQPITAPEVNEIRGVDSSGVFGSLLARKLIATAGRKQVLGRPILYKTTREFLLRFGLKDIAELPSMEEFEKLADIELEEPDTGTSPDPGMSEESLSSAASESAPEQDQSETEERLDETASALPEDVEPTETAGTAASNEIPIPEEADPAAPPATEQAETESSPHGEEVQEEQ